MATLRVLKGDITTLDVDVIVNAANQSLLGGGGVDGAIHRAAGPALLDHCKRLGGCLTGEAKLTPGFNLPARHIAHTVGPIWSQNSPVETDRLLLNCYFNCLRFCLKNGLQTIAFPNISTGVYGFPIERAAKLVVSEVAKFCENEPGIKEVIFCCFDNGSKILYETELDKFV